MPLIADFKFEIIEITEHVGKNNKSFNKLYALLVPVSRCINNLKTKYCESYQNSKLRFNQIYYILCIFGLGPSYTFIEWEVYTCAENMRAHFQGNDDVFD